MVLVVIRCVSLLMALSALVPTGETAQIVPRHGTILLWEQTENQVIVVADSRSFDKARASGEESCKIQNLSDDTIFFYSGNLAEGLDTRTGKILFSQFRTARKAFDGVKSQPRSEQRLKDTADRYLKLVRPEMERLFPSMSRQDASQTIGLAGFASLDEANRPRMVFVRNAVVVPNDGRSPVHLGEPQIDQDFPLGLVGMSDPSVPPYREAREFVANKTPRANRARAKYEVLAATIPEGDKEAYYLIGAAEASLRWNSNNPYIGPPVDAVVIESAGIRWVKEKPMCRNLQRRNKAH